MNWLPWKELQGIYTAIPMWTYFGESFPGKSKAIKKIRKAGNMDQYEAAVREVFGIG